MRGVTKALLLIIFGLAVLIPFASTNPDGLEKVVESLGLRESKSIWSGLMPEYTFLLTEHPYMTKLISGLVGIFLVFVITWSVAKAIARKNRVRK